MTRRIRLHASALLCSAAFLHIPPTAAAAARQPQAPLAVSLDELESHPLRYVGLAVSVSGVVQDVYSPRLFVIDEPQSTDFDHEVAIYAANVPRAQVSKGDRVTIEGTLQTIALSGIDREWAWRQLEDDVDTDFLKRPILLATTITGASKASGVIVDPLLVAAGTADLAGRPVSLRNVRVLRLAENHGFYLDTPSAPVFVEPSHAVPPMVAPRELVSIDGVIARMPDRLPGDFQPPPGWNRHIYIVATAVTR